MTGAASSTTTRDPVKIVANIFISFIGAGVLGLPYAFKRAGILEGIFVMIAVSYFSVKAMMLLIDCKYKVLSVIYQYEDLTEEFNKDVKINIPRDKVKCVDGKNYVELRRDDHESDDESNNNKKRRRESSRSPSPRSSPGPGSAGISSSHSITYSDIGFAAFGLTGRAIVDFALLTSQIGFCCAYLIFISENLSTYLPSVEKNHWLLLLLPPLFFLTLIKDLSKFAVFSLFAQVSNIFAFTVVYWFDFQHLHLAQVQPKEFSLDGFPYYFSVAIYCFEGAGMILSLEESIAEDLRPKFKKFFVSTIVGITTLYITFGAAGYLSYGPETRDIITLNLPNNGGFNFSILVKSCLCVSLFFTYPIMLFPVFSILEKKMTIATSGVKSKVLRLFVVLLTGIIVVRVPNFGQLMALVGASCCTLLAFIMPALMHLVLFRHDTGDKEGANGRVLDYVLVCIGVTGAIIGTYDAAVNGATVD